MQKFLRFQRSLPRWSHSGIVLGRACVVLGLVGLFLVSGLGSGIKGAFAQSYCSGGSQSYVVVSGDTLGEIAARYHTSWHDVAASNHLTNPDLILPGQVLCISSGKATGNLSQGKAVKGHGNPFPYGQCTWWADQRYHQLTGIYVPWTTQSDAWKWTARAHQYHWRVSKKPSKGSIVDLQAWVQGAYGFGHVAVVEKVLGNGHVIASSMNWGGSGSHVVRVEFAPGSGVTFITF